MGLIFSPGPKPLLLTTPQPSLQQVKGEQTNTEIMQENRYLSATVFTSSPKISGCGHFLDLLRVMDSKDFSGPVHCCGEEEK